MTSTVTRLPIVPGPAHEHDGKILVMTPRLSLLGTQVVGDLAARLGTEPRLVMRALLHVGLHHQGELRDAVESMRELDLSNW